MNDFKPLVGNFPIEIRLPQGELRMLESVCDLRRLPVLEPSDITYITSQYTRDRATLLLSSGGTTGEPKLTYVPYDQGLEQILEQWRPLHRGSVLLNTFNSGRMWASHYYMQRLAESSAASVIPFGALTSREAAKWAPRFADFGVTAVAGTPTGLADFAEGVLSMRENLEIDTIIWMAEPWSDAKLELVMRAFPHAGFWGNYGSVETYVIAFNDPKCTTDTLHLLQGQLLELDDQGAILTRTGDGWTAPVVRYRLGDRIASSPCRCGREAGIKILSRADDMVKFRGASFRISDVIEVVRRLPGVSDVQLDLVDAEGSRRSVEKLTICFTGTAASEDVLAGLVESYDRFSVVFSRYPSALSVKHVERLARVERTTKVPLAVWSQTR